MAIKTDTFSSAGGGAGTDNLDDVTSRGATTTNAITVGGVTVGTEYSLPTLDGSANQVLQTNGTGTVSFATLDFTGGLEYKGAFNATAGTPSLANAEKGDFYIIDTAGTIYGQTWAVGDHLLINEDMGGSITNSKIDKIDNTQAVTSVNTQTGAVVVSGNDILADHTAVNYTAANNNIDGHFSGVDTKLGTLLSDITSESLNDLSDVSFTAGAGIDNYVLTYDNATTSWGAEVVPSAPVTSVNTQTGAVVISGNDILADHTAVNYTASNNNVDGHFSGVDSKLGTLLADITSESLNDLSDVSFTAGAGIDNYVLTYDNATTSWGAEAAPTASAASETVAGVIEIATNAEATAGTATDKALVPSNISSLDLSAMDNTTSTFIALSDIPTASHSTAGILETATNAEATNATANDKIITPANLSHIDLSTFDNDAGFISDITSESLNDLSDVSFTAGAGIDNYVLTYDNATTSWGAEIVPSAPVTSVNTQTGAVVVSGNDILADHTAVNYTSANNNVDGHFSGVDSKLGTLLADITSESLNDLSDVSFTAGAGIDNYVLTYDHATTSWGAEASAGGGGGSDFTAVTADVARTDFAVTNYYTVLEESTQHSIYLPNYFEGDALGDFQNKRITVDNQGETTVRVLLRTSGTTGNRLYGSYEDFGSLNYNQNTVVISSITYAYIDIPAFTTYKLTCREHATVSYWFVEPFIMQFDNFSPANRDILVYNSTTEKYENSSDRSELIYSFQNSNFTAEVGYYYYVDSTAGDITVSLSTDATVVGKRFKIFKAKSANSVIITESNATNTIDPDDGAAGATSRSIQARSMIEFIAYSTSADYTYIITPQVEINDSDLNASGEFLIYDASVGAKQLITAPYTMPSSDGSANQILSTDGAGSLSFIDQPSGTQPTLTSASPSANYTISTHDGIEEIYILTPTANVSVFLPSASSCGSGYKYHIKNMASGFTLTIDANSTETIDGSTTASIANQYEALTLVTDGSNWFII